MSNSSSRPLPRRSANELMLPTSAGRPADRLAGQPILIVDWHRIQVFKWGLPRSVISPRSRYHVASGYEITICYRRYSRRLTIRLDMAHLSVSLVLWIRAAGLVDLSALFATAGP